MHLLIRSSKASNSAGSTTEFRDQAPGARKRAKEILAPSFFRARRTADHEAAFALRGAPDSVGRVPARELKLYPAPEAEKNDAECRHRQLSFLRRVAAHVVRAEPKLGEKVPPIPKRKGALPRWTPLRKVSGELGDSPGDGGRWARVAKRTNAFDQKFARPLRPRATIRGIPRAPIPRHRLEILH